MRFFPWIKDRLYRVAIYAACLVTVALFMGAFGTDRSLTAAVVLIMTAAFLIIGFFQYNRRKNFYGRLIDLRSSPFEKYITMGLLERPSFYEGRIVRDALSDMSKSMRNRVREAEDGSRRYKEYIEMWIHEIKIPLSAISLYAQNRPAEVIRQVDRAENCLEQAMYYARSESDEKDYRIAPVELGKAVRNAAVKNMNSINRRGISFRTQNLSLQVMSDGKRLEFIIGQIIYNRVKYKKESDDSFILCNAFRAGKEVKLTITDNGMGIPESDLPKVFDKSFTGENGRKRASSTGMGLFIVRNLRQKLGIKRRIFSRRGKATAVQLTFCENDFYRPLSNLSQM